MAAIVQAAAPATVREKHAAAASTMFLGVAQPAMPWLRGVRASVMRKGGRKVRRCVCL